jgi:D-alanyl-D-alanine carboxypeptidase
MNQTQIIKLQERIGALPDGFWGPKSIAACQKYLRAMMPAPTRFPADGTSQFTSLYGPNGVKDGYTPPMKTITLPFTVFYENKAVKKLSAHVNCADSLLAVFERLAVAFPTQEARKEVGILTYDGLYNPRLKRGSSTSWSMHSWACAIDFHAAKNGNKTSWPVQATMPVEVMECFAKEGWLAAGAFWGRDAMHFQATA